MRAEQADELQQLMRLAQTLKSYVNETTDPYYMSLFLEASQTILQQAQARSQVLPEPPQAPAGSAP